MTRSYYAPHGGHPPQTELLTGRAVFTEAYAVIPKGVMRDIVTSVLPFWDDTRAWVIARPLSGFAETFSQYIMEVAPGGGSEKPEPSKEAEGVLFVVEGDVVLTLDGWRHDLKPGGSAYLAPGVHWALRNESEAPVRFHWVRKAYEAVDGIHAPESFVTSDQEVKAIAMPGTASMCSKARPSTVSTATGWRSRQVISCGCAPSARKPATPAAPGASATCSTRT